MLHARRPSVLGILLSWMGLPHGKLPAWSHHADMLLCLGAGRSFIPCDKESLSSARNSLSRHCLSSLGFSQDVIWCWQHRKPPCFWPYVVFRRVWLVWWSQDSTLAKTPAQLLSYLRLSIQAKFIFHPSCSLLIISASRFQGLSHLGPGVILSNCRLSHPN